MSKEIDYLKKINKEMKEVLREFYTGEINLDTYVKVLYLTTLDVSVTEASEFEWHKYRKLMKKQLGDV